MDSLNMPVNLAAMGHFNKVCKNLLFFGLLIASIRSNAQYENGSIIGSIHDGTGAVVGNAIVVATNVGTGNTVKVYANGSGDYEVPSLRVGVYNLQATAPGFAPAQAKNITVSVAGRERIDLTLNVGQADATTVEVSDVALQLATEPSERGHP